MVAAWKKEQHARLSEAFSDPDTVVLAEDEMVLTQATPAQKVWIPQGTTPAVIETNGTRKSRSIYGFLNMKTGKEHAFPAERQTMYERAAMLAKIRKCYPKEKILLLYGMGLAGIVGASLKRHWLAIT